jgi:hypothetical protein
VTTKKKIVDFDPEKRLTPVEEVAHLERIVAYLAKRDPQRQGLRVRDIVEALYPDGQPAKGDGHNALRTAIEQICRTFPGRVPDTKRVGLFFSKMDGVIVLGGGKLRRTNADSVGTILWTAVVDSDAVAPLSSIEENSAADRPRRPYQDDAVGSRQLIELDVGVWLSENASKFPAPPPGPLDVVSAAAVTATPKDVVLRSGSWVCIVYTKDSEAIGDRFRIDVNLWNAIGDARKNGANVFLSFCDDNRGMLSFDSYDRLAWMPEEARAVEGSWLYFQPQALTSVGWFKAVVPHIQMLRGRSDASLSAMPLNSLSKFHLSMLKNDPELAAAVQRGWLLSRTKPEDGLVNIWSRRCEIHHTIDLYACVYSTARGVVPGTLRGHVRLDLFCANLAFSQTQLDAVLEQLAPHLSPTEHQAIQPTPVFLAVTCDGRMAESVATVLYDHASRLRPKRLRPMPAPASSS